MKQPKFAIDIVIPWVDQNDPRWLVKFNQFKSGGHDSTSEIRFRDYGTLRYVFRSIERYAPWVHRVFLITDDQAPEWVEKSYEKLTLVNHSDYIDPAYLPTFDSNVIELSLPNIPSLAEHFICFNDDTFLNRPVKPSDFFDVSGNPRDTLAMNAIMPWSMFEHTYVNNLIVVNHEFAKFPTIKRNLTKFFNFHNGRWNVFTFLLLPWPKFTRFYDPHIPTSFVKTTYRQVLRDNPEILSQTGADHFRTEKDYSNWVIRYIQMLSGKFTPRSYRFGVHYNLDDWRKVVSDIQKSKHHLLNVNDSETMDDQAFSVATGQLEKVFKTKFPHPSKYENDSLSK